MNQLRCYMHERIKEPFYSFMYKASIGWNEHLFQVPPELLEKFAMSIVEKCIEICKDMDGVDNFEQYMHPRSPRYDCACEIRDYFGVETD